MDNLKINCVNVELDDDIRDYVEKKLKSLEKFININDKTTTIDVRISKAIGGQQTGKIFNTEMSIMTPTKKYGVGESGSTVYESIDLVKDAIQRKMSDFKGRKRGFLKRGGAKIKNLLKFGK